MSLLDAFKKKGETNVPDISGMVSAGMSDQDIIDSLKQQGYDNSVIRQALMAKSAPQQQTQQQSTTQVAQQAPQQQIEESTQQQSAKQDQPKGAINEETLDTIQAILEQIIEEKWKTSSSEIEFLKNNLKRVDDFSHSVLEQLDKLSQRVDAIQNVMIGKTEEYNKALMDVNVELEAFNKVIDKLVPAMSDSIKELRDLISDFKSQKPGA
ncbi:MAG: hypothetical protein ACP5RE_02270 [Candidatus Acidifodinimicrobium sp.]